LALKPRFGEGRGSGELPFENNEGHARGDIQTSTTAWASVE
jgi:hypothetical protein